MRRPGDPDFSGDLADIELLSDDALADFRRCVGDELVDRYFDGDPSALPVEVTRIVVCFQKLTAELAEIRAEWSAEGGEPTAEERAQMIALVAELQAEIEAIRAALE